MVENVIWLTEVLVGNQKNLHAGAEFLGGERSCSFQENIKKHYSVCQFGGTEIGTGASVGAGYYLKSQPFFFFKQTRWVCVEMLMAYKQTFRNNRSQLLKA